MSGSELRIEIEQGRLQFADAASPLFESLSVGFPVGSWSSVLGKSGCGKTSLLRLLAGLLSDSAHWQGSITHPFASGLHENIAYMAQQDLLMPWLNVQENVCLSDRFGPKTLTGEQHQSRLRKAQQLLSSVGLEGKELLYPRQLSGGMRQRVALARTLMQDKPLVLMDEPFSALDAVTRYRLQDLAHQVLQDKTVVLITHDPQEALRLSDHIYLMHSEPAILLPVAVPPSATPRSIDADMAEIQQHIIHLLGMDHD